MKNALLPLSSGLLGGLAGAWIHATVLDAPPAREASADPGAPAQVAALERALGELRTRVVALDQRLAAQPLASPAQPAARAPELSQEALEAAVAAVLARQEGGAARSLARTEQRERVEGIGAAPIADLMEMLRDGNQGSFEGQELWQAIRDAGRMDDVLAEFERLAEASPRNPDLQAELGEAYIQKIFEVGGGPLAGKYGNLADQAFDRALEADPEHWEARFQKAVALSNWPEFMGKMGESLHQFETLVEQQERQAAKPQFAQTYFFLGNMYQRKGDAKAALDAWRRGLALFPDSEMLREQIRLNE